MIVCKVFTLLRPDNTHASAISMFSILAALQGKISIDSMRIYVAGMSNSVTTTNAS
ncbi:MAG: hypothetical protein H8D37_03865 [Chloroflexi bacterium]|nr:hypothetical protein [Chloroflexota bacterium]